MTLVLTLHSSGQGGGLKRLGIVIGLMGLLMLSCGLSRPAPAATEPATEKVEPTPTPLPERVTLQEAWELAGPTVREWAIDARMSEEFACQGVLTPDGRCNRWYGVLVSAAQDKVAELEVVPDRVVSISPVSAPLGRYLDNALDPDGIVDSPQAAQQAWAWLEAQELKREDTRLRWMGLRANPGVAGECGVSPAYVTLFWPQGRLCLDPYSGQITSNSFGR
jgi:hypothetical protein